jgi:hypothetical protein
MAKIAMGYEEEQMSVVARNQERESLMQRAQASAAANNKLEQDLFGQMHSGTRDVTLVVPGEAEPQEDSGPFCDGNEDSDNVVVGSKPKRIVKSKAGGSRKKKAKIIEEVEDEDWGDMMDVIGFHWSTVEQPEFIVRWSKGGKLKHPAGVVLADFTEEALLVLWKGYRNVMPIVNWINGLDCMKEIVDGWDGFESYAARLGWVLGSFVDPGVAVAKVEKTRGKKVKGNAFAEMLEECLSPTGAAVGIQGKDARLCC